MADRLNRRKLLKNLSLGAGILSVPGISGVFASELNSKTEVWIPYSISGKINHSVCRWCYQDIPLEKFAKACAKMGLKGIDLLKPSEWDTVEKEGLVCTMATDVFASITEGFNDLKNHAVLQEKYRGLIKKASERKIRNVICFSGNRNGMDEATGITNCVKGLTPLLDYARELNVNLVMELLNSKVDHKDYMCDHTDWGVKLAKRLNKPNFKLLYDIYHMQIMEGDVIRTIRENYQYINHYHTGGVPGRNEINDSQELNYPAIMEAIHATGFDGFVAQEFIPTYDDKLAALREGIQICDI
ncbi:hydroxypyruvate isomerase family protein [Christiangramia sabulilitoris]|uniref:TIM barrel protein n=1 Tax=Christiangramia sabulilitoris TaxID=2583991 RepID=A0A550I2L9_9FLAO|nr:TIM barrel protein [Christiangramia sabulilitoris]TRO65215.1 TIM barrel protein [Christiangramia sabulilitoris]